MPKKTEPQTLGDQLKKISKERYKKDRFIRSRMWFSTFIAALYNDRGSIPVNIGNNLMIGNNIYISKNALSAVIVIKEMSTDTPVAFMSELIRSVKGRVPDITIDFTLKNRRHHYDVHDNGLKSRIRSWQATLEAPMTTDVQKRRAARLLYSVDIVRSGEQMYYSNIYITVRAKTGAQLNRGLEQATSYLASIGAVYKIVKNDIKSHLDLMFLMSDHRTGRSKDMPVNVMSRQTLAEILPDTQGMNDDTGTFLGIDQKMLGPYFINFRATAKAKNIILAAEQALVQVKHSSHKTGLWICMPQVITCASWTSRGQNLSDSQKPLVA